MTSSFPFLKIARDRGIDYGIIIRFAESCWDAPEPSVVIYNPVMFEVWDAVKAEQARRQLSDGMFIVSEVYRTDDEAAP